VLFANLGRKVIKSATKEEICFVICPSYTRKFKLIKLIRFYFSSYMRQNNTRLHVILISLCFGLYLGLIIRGPHISPYKGFIRVYFRLESV
jgi:hypothetical protein